MQQDNVTPNSVTTVETEDSRATPGPVLLQPEMLMWVSGGVSSPEELPHARW